MPLQVTHFHTCSRARVPHSRHFATFCEELYKSNFVCKNIADQYLLGVRGRVRCRVLELGLLARLLSFENVKSKQWFAIKKASGELTIFRVLLAFLVLKNLLTIRKLKVIHQ